MKWLLPMTIALLALGAPRGAAAPQDAAPAATSPTASSTITGGFLKPTAPPAARSTKPASTKRGGAAAADGKPAAAGSRSLEDIHIEGEIAVPQVLFITARDQRRFLDLEHRRWLRGALDIGEATVVPHRIAWIRTPTEARKETPR